MNDFDYVLVIHGGAGTIAPAAAAAQQPYHDGLRAALQAGQALLAGGASALDAVVAAVACLEDDPHFNAGHGAVFNADGRHELDAAVMDGASLQAGAVAAVGTVRNPVRGALAVLRDGRHVLLCGGGAERLCRAGGVALVDPSYFSTAARLAQWRAAHGGIRLDHDSAPEGDAAGPFGTVGAVARDAHGHLAAATSTGGMTNKLAGRIGDSPTIGAGCYANDAGCAVSATGSGEHFMRACLAHDVHARMVYGGAPLEQAARAALAEGLAPIGGRGGLIAVDREGHICLPFNSTGMYRGWVRAGAPPETRIFAD